MHLIRNILIVSLLLALPATAADLSKLKAWGDEPTPALSLPDLDGKTRTLSDYAGKVVIVNFWATWCGPCIREMPSLVRLAKKFSGKPFVLLTVNFGENEKRIKAFLKKNDLDLTVLVDADMSASQPWVKKGLPTTFIIDAEQKVRYEVRGEMEWDSREIEDLIGDLFPRS